MPMNTMCVRAVVGTLVGAAAALFLAPSAHAQPIVPLGAGEYYASTPAGFEVPSDNTGAPVSPRVTASFVGPPPTNTWWSSLIWQRYPGNAFGEIMHPNPLAMKAQAVGLEVSAPRTPSTTSTDYFYSFTRAFTISVPGLNAPAVRVAAAGDWTVTAEWASPGRSLRATFGRGLPYVYADITGPSASVAFNAAGSPQVWSNSGNVVGVTIAGTPYGLFAPAGATWSIASNTATSTLAGRTYFAVAALPDAQPATLALFAQHAFAFVTDTRVAWAYSPSTSTADATYTFITQAREGTQTTPIVAAYRHQWLNSTQPFTTYTYPSARGVMKVAVANQVSARYPFRGVVPKLPNVGAIPTPTLFNLVNTENQAQNLGLANDTYGAGRGYGKIAQLLHIAHDAGHTAARDRFLSFLRDELGEWLTVGPYGTGPNRSAYQPIEAESFNTAQGVSTGPAPTGQAVIEFSSGDWIKYSNVDFSNAVPNRLLLQYASTSGGSGSFEVRLNSLTGPVIAGGGVGGTGGQWQEIPLGMSPGAAQISGVHDVYFTLSTPYPGELCRIDSFRFDRAGSPPDRFFAFNPAWSTLIGYPASYGSAGELNDHHFHYGYFIYAAAAVAQFDPAWASSSQFGPMINLLIRDAANPNRADTTYPFLRNFDVYAGHSQASGHAGFGAGNNQESSSEAINFATALILWGAATNDTATRDLGIYLYACESAAIIQYWFDPDNAVFPAAAPKKIAGIVWDSGAAWGTWFSGEPEHIHGINFLPITTGSLHLGARPDAILKSYNTMTAARGGPPVLWQFTLWNALAMADPAQALALLNANPGYTPDGPDSKAVMEQWIRTLNAVGVVDPAVSADSPHTAVFTKAGVRTYWAWNPTASPLTVRFTDGRAICVQPGATISVAASQTTGPCACPADFNASGSATVQDIFDFLAAYFAGCTAPGPAPCVASADINASGALTVQDIFDFLAAYFLGC